MFGVSFVLFANLICLIVEWLIVIFFHFFPGDLYDRVAGVDGFVDLQLYDEFRNIVTYGGAALELVLLGVGGSFRIFFHCFQFVLDIF